MDKPGLPELSTQGTWLPMVHAPTVAEADLAAAAALFEQSLPAKDTPDAELATIELRLAELAARRGRVDDAIAAVRADAGSPHGRSGPRRGSRAQGRRL